ncbi:MAG: NAD(P)/FAD-dependent oxidoreductase, partial [Armatimonadetes bacterium]|nr:NAD(P)/FAD-dependent oxidoreductase [Armatimonadota bacterium]
MSDTIAVIGGGPAGTSCAIKLIKEARALRKNIRVVMFEGKYFETHYNQCVGVLSPPLLRILKEELEIELPRDLIKRRIFAYRLHADKEEVFLLGEEKEGPTYTVHRVNFDKFMLDFAKKIGVEIIHSRVNGLEFIRTKELEEVRVYSESGYLRADAVVCAFGLDESMLNVLEESTKNFCPYKRPKRFLRTFITKLETATGFIEKKLGNIIYAYLMPENIPNIEFGAISPKEEHIVINIAGEKITSLDLDKFLKLPQVRKYLPEFKHDELSYFEGHFPIAPAVNCFGDRFLVAGDATGWMRSFKGKGINTAVITGIEAAKVLIESDFSKDNFKKYAERARELLSDYYYGKLARYFCKWGAKFKFLSPLIKAARVDQNIYEALYDAVSGHNTYKNIFKNLLYFNLTKTLKRLF